MNAPKWNTIDKLFDNIRDSGINVVLAEFGECGIEVIDYYGFAKKILDGKAMHIDSVCENPTHWMMLHKLTAYLEKRNNIKNAKVQNESNR